MLKDLFFSYVKSISWDQIRGQKVSASNFNTFRTVLKSEKNLGTLSTKCTSIQTMSDVSDDPGFSVSGFLIESDQPASPCGLIAKSFFNGKNQFPHDDKDFKF